MDNYVARKQSQTVQRKTNTEKEEQIEIKISKQEKLVRKNK